MEIRDEIIAKVDQLPASVQEEVLQYVSALNAELPRTGYTGAELFEFAGTLDHESAREMTAIIEREFGQIDPDEW